MSNNNNNNNNNNNTKLGVIVPLYTSPQINEAAYVQIAGISRKYPREQTIVVQDINQGPGLGPDPIVRDKGINMLKANGVTVLGYVQTSPMSVNNNASIVKQSMLNWKEWYPNIDGFYFAGVPRQDGDLEFYKDITHYAKSYLEVKLIAAEFQFRNGSGAHIPRNLVDFTPIDLFVIYNARGYPLPLPALRSDNEWHEMQQKTDDFPYSKFGIIVTNVSAATAETSLQAQNFIRQAIGTEKVASYVYLQTDSGAREIHPEPFTSLSSLFETTLITLDEIADGKGVPFVKPLMDEGLLSKEQLLRGVALTDTVRELEQIASEGDRDRFGAQKKYPNAKNKQVFQEWYFQQDRSLKEIKDRDKQLGYKESSNLRLMQDGSNSWYMTTGGLQVWSESPTKKWLNTETTVYTFLINNTKSVERILELSVRTGKQLKCEGACYSSVLFSDGRTAVQKKPAYGLSTPNRGAQPATQQPLKGQWLGFRQVVYNYRETGKEADPEHQVMIENYIDDNCTDKNGQLVMKNNWKLVASFIDNKGKQWGLTKKADEKKLEKMGCKSLDISRKGEPRKSTDVINTTGGGSGGNDKEEGNSVILSVPKEGVEIKFKNFGIREIQPPDSD